MTDIEILAKLVSYNTTSNSDSFMACANYIASALKDKGWKLKFVANKEGNKKNLIAILNGKLNNISEGLLLSGHIDTVVTNDENWATVPHQLTIKDNVMFGLGIADMKYFTASILANLDNINALKLKKPLLFCITSDEETNMQGINAITDFFKLNKITPEFAIIGEPNCCEFSNSNKGFYEFETNIIGKTCHSSNPKLGINSIYVMSKFVSYIEKLNSKFKDTTINVGVINGGKICNAVPDLCTIRWDVRTFSRKILSEIMNLTNVYLKQLAEKYNNSFNNQIVFKIPAFENRKNCYSDFLINKYGFKEKPYQAATEAGYFQELGIDCSIFGVGDINDAHAVNEKLNIEDYKKYQNILIEMIKDICC